MERRYRLLISCPDRPGIVARVSSFLASYGGWITEANHHADPRTGCFFMRNEIKADSLPFDLNTLKAKFEPVAEEFSMTWSITDSFARKNVVLMVSKESHCLEDILPRWQSGELSANIVGVISNHEDMRKLVEWHDIPYRCVPIEKQNKQSGFAVVEQVLEELKAEVVVLARYMQVLPSSLCQKFQGGIINIHHSFLPSFAGAKPYHQAYDRGVKLIGATCHYVTDMLDEGPIIEQDVIRVSHRESIEDMVRLGKDVEKAVLSRGLRLHLEDRVVIHENKTIVLN
jgi:formyltetrahydrofolate deformylase